MTPIIGLFTIFATIYAIVCLKCAWLPSCYSTPTQLVFLQPLAAHTLPLAACEPPFRNVIWNSFKIFTVFSLTPTSDDLDNPNTVVTFDWQRDIKQTIMYRTQLPSTHTAQFRSVYVVYSSGFQTCSRLLRVPLGVRVVVTRGYADKFL